MTQLHEVDQNSTLSEKELCPEKFLAGQKQAFARDIERLKARSNEFTTVPCPACGNADSPVIFKKFSFTYRSCPQCQTLYMNPRPTPDLLAEYYANSENYRYWAEYIFPASEKSRREKIHRPRLLRVLEYCQRHNVPTRTLLEVGPGFGTFSSLVMESEQFNRVVAVEPTPEMAAACRSRGVEVFPHRVEDLGKCIGAMDVAVAFEVVEHLFEPRAFIEAMAAQLSPNGLLVLSCPNGLGFDISTLGPRSLAVDAEHINLFNPESLSHLVANCGFEVLEVSTPGRLDAEFVREAVLAGKYRLADNPFLRLVLIDEWPRLGEPFQAFLAENGLSSHMWLAARKLEV
jgi:2-polyprenyl-3-methyl-5-hydroxy-6-metoxy-1,4-benzoquinol methylase/ribosomal protein S27E